MKPKNHAEATRNYLEYELEEKILKHQQTHSKEKNRSTAGIRSQTDEYETVIHNERLSSLFLITILKP